MKYMLMIYGAEEGWTDDERERCMLDSMAICEELAVDGKWLDSSPLHSVATATSVRVRDGKSEVTDGPFAETTEQLGGYYIIDVPTRDEAVAIASRLPPAKKGTVEIRPLLPVPIPMPSLSEDLTSLRTKETNAGKDYIVLLYAAEGAWPPEEHAAALEESIRLCHELHEQGSYRAAAPLQSPTTATCVRLRGGVQEIVDGPFPETKEQLGGYFLIHVADLDQAISVAAKIPGARRGTAEIRPLFPLPVVHRAS